MQKNWPLAILLLIFLAPILAAAYVLWPGNNIKFNTVQHGDFIHTANNNQFKNINKWQVVYIKPQNCGLECQQQQDILNNMLVALGANAERVIITISSTPDLQTNSIYIINPTGLPVMLYQPPANISGLLKDLKRLLKYSHV